LDVILLLNPLSNGEGRGLALSVVAAAMLLVAEDANVDGDDIEVASVVLSAFAEDVESRSSRGWSSSVSGSGTGSAAH